MKKIILLSLFVGLIFSVRAQSAGTFSQTASNPTGAITNTSVDTMTYTLTRSYTVVSISPVVTKATGTMAGWSVLDYSVDGSHWKIGTDTLYLSDQTTNTTVWDKQTAARYLRIRTGGATTVTGTVSAKVSASQ